MNVEVLGTWSANPRFSKFALTAGRDTTVVVSSSSSSSHAICELATDGVSLKVGRKFFGDGAIEVPAFKSVDGQISFARRTPAGDVLPDHVGGAATSPKGRGDEAASAADCF